MKIERAIEILSQAEEKQYIRYTPELIDALKLGIEGLKLLQRYRKTGHVWASESLPGETKD